MFQDNIIKWGEVQNEKIIRKIQTGKESDKYI